MKTKKSSLFTFFFNVVIDLGLICMGALLYYHFMIKPFAPIDLHPVVIQVFGSKKLAVLVISGAPFIAGAFSLLRTLFRAVKGFTVSLKQK